MIKHDYLPSSPTTSQNLTDLILKKYKKVLKSQKFREGGKATADESSTNIKQVKGGKMLPARKHPKKYQTKCQQWRLPTRSKSVHPV